MKKVNTSTKNMDQYAGKWVVIDPRSERIVAVGNNPREISSFVVHGVEEKILPVGEAPYSYLVPRKDEGPYVLWIESL